MVRTQADCRPGCINGYQAYPIQFLAGSPSLYRGSDQFAPSNFPWGRSATAGFQHGVLQECAVTRQPTPIRYIPKRAVNRIIHPDDQTHGRLPVLDPVPADTLPAHHCSYLSDFKFQFRRELTGGHLIFPDSVSSVPNSYRSIPA